MTDIPASDLLKTVIFHVQKDANEAVNKALASEKELRKLSDDYLFDMQKMAWVKPEPKK